MYQVISRVWSEAELAYTGVKYHQSSHHVRYITSPLAGCIY
jgi:hypothetical protein